MESPCYLCDGVNLDGLWLPPFQLCAREAVCLHLPALKSWEERERFVEVLTGIRPLKGLHPLRQTRYAEPPQSRGGLLGLWPQPRTVDWLRRRAGMSVAAAREIIARLKLREEWRISHLAMNLRTLLGLEAAYACGAEVIVFATIGCDPLGTKTVFETVSARLDQCAAIHLSYPYSTNGEVRRSCLPGARCVEVVSLADSSVTAVSSVS